MINEKDFFKKDNIATSNWHKMDTVGARVFGEVVAIFDKEAKDQFPAQRCFTLKQPDGALINYGVKVTSDYLMGRTNQVKLGDYLGFEFVKEIPPSKKGLNPAKSIECYYKKGEPKPLTEEEEAQAKFDGM